MALPFLPGNSFNQNIGKTKFHKSQFFALANDVPKFVGEVKPGVGGEMRSDQTLPPPHTKFPKGEGQTLPTWIAFDRQVLTFYAYYKEAVHEKQEEQYRVKQCKIYFYLEDDTIQVTELQKKNSGIFQGTLIRRHRIPKPPPNENKFYTLEDFNIQNTVEFYTKVFKIIDCDQFTHSFLYKMGVRLREPCPLPIDPYTEYRKNLEENQQPLRPFERFDPLGQFLLHDREVLRFYCQWDDTDNMFGDMRDMVMHYYLADDTVELNEVIKLNSGRDNAPQFLKRGRLPKVFDGLAFPGQTTARTVLNVFGSVYSQNRYIFDSLKTGAVDVPYYTAADFQLGHKINVYGRPLLLCDCDEFTKEFYRAKFGIKEFTPVKRAKTDGVTMEKTYPPFNGFGGEEDSLGNCKDLIPKPPQKNFIQFMEKDKQGLESNVLRFLAKLDSKISTDKQRKFIISYYLSDDTIDVFEPPITNSGIGGGKFLCRGPIKKPGQPRFNNKLPDYYKAQDLSIGQTVVFASHRFIIIDADEYAFNYMEAHPKEFPKTDVKTIIESIRCSEKYGEEQVTKKFLFKDPESCDLITYANMAEILTDLQPNITEHELLAIARHYEEIRGYKEKPIVQILARVREKLRKNNFDNYDDLLSCFKYEDQQKNGFLPKTSIRLLMLAQQIPLPQDLLTLLLTNFPDANQDVINYNEFVSHIDWRKDNQPIRTYQAEDPRKNIRRLSVDTVNYKRLLADLYSRSS